LPVVSSLAAIRRRAALPVDVLDAALAAATLGMVGVQLAWEPPDAALYRYLAFSPLITLPLAWRRRAPLRVVAVVAAALVAQALVAEPAIAFGEFLAVMLASYSVAAHAPRSQAAVGAVLALAAVGIHTMSSDEPVGPFEWIYGVVYFGGAFALGRIVRARASNTERLAERASRLEREQEELARAAAAAERARIARDLHDVIAHTVGVMVVQAGAARIAAEADPAAARAAMGRVEDTGREALGELRRLLGVLRDDDMAEREPQPGLDGVEALVARARAAGLEVELAVRGPRRQLPIGLELAAYRVVQEALTNVLRHAGPVRVRVGVDYAPAALDVAVDDDGVGNGTVHATGGHGLVGMRERVELYGGSLEVGHEPGVGFRVHARFPLAPAA
jgi:signal transduction histidine kinase